MDNVINTIAGAPNDRISSPCSPEQSPDGKLALNNIIPTLASITVSPDGLLYLFGNGRIIQIDSSGIMHTIAGMLGGCLTGFADSTTGILANCGDFFGYSTKAAQGPDKSWYITNYEYNWIYRISPEGEITRFAGIGYDAGPYGRSPVNLEEMVVRQQMHIFAVLVQLHSEKMDVFILVIRLIIESEKSLPMELLLQWLVLVCKDTAEMAGRQPRL